MTQQPSNIETSQPDRRPQPPAGAHAHGPGNCRPETPPCQLRGRMKPQAIVVGSVAPASTSELFSGVNCPLPRATPLFSEFLSFQKDDEPGFPVHAYARACTSSGTRPSGPVSDEGCATPGIRPVTHLVSALISQHPHSGPSVRSRGAHQSTRPTPTGASTLHGIPVLGRATPSPRL